MAEKEKEKERYMAGQIVGSEETYIIDNDKNKALTTEECMAILMNKIAKIEKGLG